MNLFRHHSILGKIWRLSNSILRKPVYDNSFAEYNCNLKIPCVLQLCTTLMHPKVPPSDLDNVAHPTDTAEYRLLCTSFPESLSFPLITIRSANAFKP